MLDLVQVEDTTGHSSMHLVCNGQNGVLQTAGCCLSHQVDRLPTVKDIEALAVEFLDAHAERPHEEATLQESVCPSMLRFDVSMALVMNSMAQHCHQLRKVAVPDDSPWADVIDRPHVRKMHVLDGGLHLRYCEERRVPPRFVIMEHIECIVIPPGTLHTLASTLHAPSVALRVELGITKVQHTLACITDGRDVLVSNVSMKRCPAVFRWCRALTLLRRRI